MWVDFDDDDVMDTGPYDYDRYGHIDEREVDQRTVPAEGRPFGLVSFESSGFQNEILYTDRGPHDDIDPPADEEFDITPDPNPNDPFADEEGLPEQQPVTTTSTNWPTVDPYQVESPL